MSGGYCNILGKKWMVAWAREVAWEMEVIAHNLFPQNSPALPQPKSKQKGLNKLIPTVLPFTFCLHLYHDIIVNAVISK